MIVEVKAEIQCYLIQGCFVLYWCLPWCLSQCLLIPTDSWDEPTRALVPHWKSTWAPCHGAGVLGVGGGGGVGVPVTVLVTWVLCEVLGGDVRLQWLHYCLCLSLVLHYSLALINTPSSLPAASTSRPATNRLSEAPPVLNTPGLSCLLTRHRTMAGTIIISPPANCLTYILYQQVPQWRLHYVLSYYQPINWKSHSGIRRSMSVLL